MTTEFTEIWNVKYQNEIPLRKFKSKRTGLSVVIADIQGPLAYADIMVATKAEEDEGCPHTLEHEQYPYKGVLDEVANLNFAKGTNAWTSVDHTCYTLETAGGDGLLNILPVYLNHILYPTLTSAGCYTEVHHINSNMEDAGVVYCEMEGRENSSNDRLFYALKKKFHEKGCGYRCKTGGATDRLRTLTPDEIRAFHKTYYQPENICVLIRGDVDNEKLFNVLCSFDQRITNNSLLSPIIAPWKAAEVCSIPRDLPLQRIYFPDNDESSGKVVMAWKGPLIMDRLANVALEILMEYLLGSQISELKKAFVDIGDPHCTDMCTIIGPYSVTEISIWMEGVPCEKMDELPRKVMEVLNNIVATSTIEMDRMIALIDREIQKIVYSLDDGSIQDVLQYDVISDALYGQENGDMITKAARWIDQLKELRDYKVSDWTNLIERWFLQQPHVALLGIPSAKYEQQLKDEKAKRIEDRKRKFGPQKAAELEEELKKATDENNTPIPIALLDQFTEPDAASVKFINVVTASSDNVGKYNNEIQEHVDRDQCEDQHLNIQFDHIESKFVVIEAAICTSTIPTHLLPYVDMYLRLIKASPVEKDGEQIPYQEVIKSMDKDTIEYDIKLGIWEALDMISIKFVVEATKYHIAVKYIKDLLWNIRFIKERVMVIAKGLLGEIPEKKRDENIVEEVATAYMMDSSRSASSATISLFQENFLQSVLGILEKHPQKVIDNLYMLRDSLCQPENIRIHVAGDILAVDKPKSTFNGFYPTKMKGELTSVPFPRDFLTPAGKHPGDLVVIARVPGITSTSSLHYVNAPAQHDHADIYALTVAIEILSAKESAVWSAIRGFGLAYHYFFDHNIGMGKVFFNIIKSTNVFYAFAKSKEIIGKISSGEIPITKYNLAAGKSAVIKDFASSEKDKFSAASKRFVRQVVRGLPPTYRQTFLEQTQKVTVENVRQMIQKYILNIFRQEVSNHFIVSENNKIPDLQKEFRENGFKVNEISLGDIGSLQSNMSSTLHQDVANDQVSIL